MDLQSFMKNRDKLQGAVNKMVTPRGGFNDADYWYPDRDATGNGRHLIRLLPQTDPERKPLVKNFYHKIKLGGKTFYEKCLSNIDSKCPICSWTSPLWEAPEGSPERKMATEYYRKRQYVGNVFVITDTVHAENNGRVAKFRVGAKLYDKIQAKFQPDEALGTAGVNVFDFIEGANFKVSVRTVGGYANYDQSEFDSISQFLGGDMKKIEAVFEQIFDLSEFEEASKHEDPEKLLDKFLQFIGQAGSAPAPRSDSAKPASAPAKKAADLPAASEPDPFNNDQLPDFSSDSTADPFSTENSSADDGADPFSDGGDSDGGDDDDEAFFKKLKDRGKK